VAEISSISRDQPPVNAEYVDSDECTLKGHQAGLFQHDSRDAIRFERTVTMGQLASLGIYPKDVL